MNFPRLRSPVRQPLTLLGDMINAERKFRDTEFRNLPALRCYSEHSHVRYSRHTDSFAINISRFPRATFNETDAATIPSEILRPALRLAELSGLLNPRAVTLRDSIGPVSSKRVHAERMAGFPAVRTRYQFGWANTKRTRFTASVTYANAPPSVRLGQPILNETTFSGELRQYGHA